MSKNARSRNQIFLSDSGNPQNIFLWSVNIFLIDQCKALRHVSSDNGKMLISKIILNFIHVMLRSRKIRKLGVGQFTSDSATLVNSRAEITVLSLSRSECSNLSQNKNSNRFIKWRDLNSGYTSANCNAAKVKSVWELRVIRTEQVIKMFLSSFFRRRRERLNNASAIKQRDTNTWRQSQAITVAVSVSALPFLHSYSVPHIPGQFVLFP